MNETFLEFGGHLKIFHPASELRPEEVADFALFTRFISNTEMDEEESRKFYELLQILHRDTGILWRPGMCKAAIIISERANIYAPLFFEHAKTEIFNNGFHYWTNLETQDQKNCIIDPAGLIKEMRGDNLPYFGMLEGCEKIPFDCYSQGKPISPEVRERLQQIKSSFRYYNPSRS